MASRRTRPTTVGHEYEPGTSLCSRQAPESRDPIAHHRRLISCTSARRPRARALTRLPASERRREPASDPLIPDRLWRNKWTALQRYLAHKQQPPPLGLYCRPTPRALWRPLGRGGGVLMSEVLLSVDHAQASEKVKTRQPAIAVAASWSTCTARGASAPRN